MRMMVLGEREETINNPKFSFKTVPFAQIILKCVCVCIVKFALKKKKRRKDGREKGNFSYGFLLTVIHSPNASVILFRKGDFEKIKKN